MRPLLLKGGNRCCKRATLRATLLGQVSAHTEFMEGGTPIDALPKVHGLWNPEISKPKLRILQSMFAPKSFSKSHVSRSTIQFPCLATVN